VSKYEDYATGLITKEDYLKYKTLAGEEIEKRESKLRELSSVLAVDDDLRASVKEYAQQADSIAHAARLTAAAADSYIESVVIT